MEHSFVRGGVVAAVAAVSRSSLLLRFWQGERAHADVCALKSLAIWLSWRERNGLELDLARGQARDEVHPVVGRDRAPWGRPDLASFVQISGEQGS